MNEIPLGTIRRARPFAHQILDQMRHPMGAVRLAPGSRKLLVFASRAIEAWRSSDAGSLKRLAVSARIPSRSSACNQFPFVTISSNIASA